MATADSGAVGRLKSGETLRPGEMTAFMKELMAGRLEEAFIVEFLTALRARGETQNDLIEAARAMREASIKVAADVPGLLDTCGTGGDGKGTMNVSTLAAIGAAAAGVPVAKHGNRSVSGHFGSADLLEAFGVKIGLTPEQTAASIRETGFGFIFAPNFHPAMKHAAGARKKIAGRTLFNCLGPLTNPAGAKRQLLGVYAPGLVETAANALGSLGSERAIVVHGEDGLDEVSLSGPTRMAEWDAARRQTAVRTVRPEDFGFKRAPIAALACASREESIAAATEVLEGRMGPRMDFTVLNTAFALIAAGKAGERDAGALAKDAFVSGRAMKKLDQIRKFSERA